MNIFELEGIKILVPNAWWDITDDLGPECPPTLARGEGAHGALQFSMAKYKSGKKPEIDSEALKELLNEFAQKQGFTVPKDHREFKSIAAASIGSDFQSTEQFLRVWLLTNTSDVLFVTYCVVGDLKADFNQELIEADEIVKAIVF